MMLIEEAQQRIDEMNALIKQHEGISGEVQLTYRDNLASRTWDLFVSVREGYNDHDWKYTKTLSAKNSVELGINLAVAYQTVYNIPNKEKRSIEKLLAVIHKTREQFKQLDTNDLIAPALEQINALLLQQSESISKNGLPKP